jgi:hypothetical protein
MDSSRQDSDIELYPHPEERKSLKQPWLYSNLKSFPVIVQYEINLK